MVADEMAGVTAKKPPKSPRSKPIGTREEWLAAMRRVEAEEDSKRSKLGRPPADRIDDLATGTRKLVLDVYFAEARLGGKRGAHAQAIRDVAGSKKGTPTERELAREMALKRHVSRRKDLRDIARLMWFTDPQHPDLLELQRRLAGMPDDVRETLKSFSARGMLKLLRENDIDGTAPAAFVDAMREFARRKAAADLLSPK